MTGGGYFLQNWTSLAENTAERINKTILLLVRRGMTILPAPAIYKGQKNSAILK